ncbi:flavin monoamine oxidase family protein, partial [Klebsiella pneumoniae]|uniref:flavin monoamine oxidase family protein n=1 Tax=Klebsiella pneumoniae TaxID=573 RepID=UPI003B5A0901
MMNIEVIIVGGGLSGLYAAMLLEKAGINYLLLEGRERMGGRILQANTVEADLGATWFWPTIQPALKQLFRELNIESFSHQERGDMLFERSKDAPSRHPGFVSSPAAARVSGGMSRLPDALLAKLKPERIQTGLQVKHIEQQNGTLNICGSYADGRPFSRQAQHVLLALPPMLAAGINFFPPLPTTLLQAWRNTGTWMAPHAKYVAVYPYNFWHRKGLSGEVRSNIGPMVEIHDVSEPDRMFALFGFIGVPFHERQKIGDAVLRDLCRGQLIRLLGEEAA